MVGAKGTKKEKIADRKQQSQLSRSGPMTAAILVLTSASLLSVFVFPHHLFQHSTFSLQ